MPKLLKRSVKHTQKIKRVTFYSPHSAVYKQCSVLQHKSKMFTKDVTVLLKHCARVILML